MSLSRGFAYCLTCKRARRIMAANLTATDSFAIHTGKCGECADNVIRIYPNDNLVTIPERDGNEGTRKTYSGEQEYSYNRGYFDPENTRAEYKTIRVDYMLSTVADSIDIRKRYDENGAPWARIVEGKASASHFDNVLRAIVENGFLLPVVMWDQYRQDEWTIGNGHHRITAAILLGLEYIPVVVSYGADYMRADDSSDDEDMPIEQADRSVWMMIRDCLPKGVAGNGDAQSQECELCAYRARGNVTRTGCCYPHRMGCPNARPVVAATGTATREGREAAEVKAAAQRAAQGAAGDAVYALIVARRNAQNAMRNDAYAIRCEIDRMIERAAQMERDAMAIDNEVAALWPLHDAAANITPRY